MTKIKVSIGIAVFNEAKNIEKFLSSLFSQKLKYVLISEIIIVSSGSTDNTNKIIRRFSKKNKKIKLITQRKRYGKATAVNVILGEARENIIVLSSADLILRENSIEKLISPLKKRNVGIVGAHPVPINSKDNFFGFAAHMLWDLHHQISLTKPKMGECIAFKKVFHQIPSLSSVDEANIDSLIKGQGYLALYAPDAIVYNKGPENLKEFISSRRRIYSGHLVTQYNYGYSVSTVNALNVFFILLQRMKTAKYPIFWTLGVILLEAYGRLLGYFDYKSNRAHTIWQRTESTKSLDL